MSEAAGLTLQRVKTVLRVIFLQHTSEKLVSLLLAGMIIFVIHRQLVTTVFDGQVEVLIGGVEEQSRGSSDRIRVLFDRSRYVVRRSESSPVSLTIRGAAKRREELPQPLRVEASLPEERFRAVSSGDWQLISLEDRDLKVTGIPDLAFNLHGGLSLEVARVIQESRPLAVDWRDRLPEGVTAEVTFQPQVANVRGAAPYLRKLAEAFVHLEPTEGQQEVQRLVSPGVSLVSGQKIVALVTLKSTFTTLVVPNVEVRLGVAHNTQYSFAFGEPLSVQGKTPVTLEGPAESLKDYLGDDAATQARKDALASALTLMVDAERTARENDARIPATAEGLQIDAPAYLLHLPEDLAKKGIRPAGAQTTVPLIIRRRP